MTPNAHLNWSWVGGEAAYGLERVKAERKEGVLGGRVWGAQV